MTDRPASSTGPDPAGLVARIRQLTRRQAAALTTAACAGGAAAVSAAAGWSGAALALVSTLMVVLAAGQVQLRRRQAQQDADRRAGHHELRQESIRLCREVSALRTELGTLADEVECGHRRLVAAVEKERAAAADRHTALQALLDGGSRQVSGRPTGETGSGQLPQARPPLQPPD